LKNVFKGQMVDGDLVESKSYAGRGNQNADERRRFQTVIWRVVQRKRLALLSIMGGENAVRSNLSAVFPAGSQNEREGEKGEKRLRIDPVEHKSRGIMRY